jgi:hypothetical protein
MPRIQPIEVLLIETVDDISVHAPGADGAGFTLCGLASDEVDPDSGILEIKPSPAKRGIKVTCQRCIAIFQHVNSIRRVFPNA